MKYKYKISVVVPIYNVEAYLEETIESVLEQTMNFKDIQLILVNDESPDNSEKICLKYKELYPDNVIYVKQKNGGVSSARNHGFEYVEGKYVNFLDSDDKWDKDVFVKAYKMFEKNNDIDIIGVRQKFFEASQAYPSLDYKFKNNKDGVYDITEHYDYIQLSVTSAFIRTEAAKTSQFDTRIKYSEDGKYIYDLFINRKRTKIGLICSSNHLYRKRFSNNSAIQVKDTRKDWYQQTVELSYMYVMERCKKEFKKIYKFAQYYIMYDYQYRVKNNLDEVINFSKEEKKKYINNTLKLIKQIDDEIILGQHKLNGIYKLFYLQLKYDSYDKAVKKRIKYINNLPINLNICLMDIKDEVLHLEGNIEIYYDEKFTAYCESNNQKYYLKLSPEECYEYPNFKKEKIRKLSYSVDLPLKEVSKVNFILKHNSNIINMDIKFHENSYMGNHKLAYRKIGKYIISRYKDYIRVSKKGRFICEVKNQISLLYKKKFKNILYRDLALLLRIFKRKQVWIVSDRENVAGDNGEAFFKYLNSVNNKKFKFYFAINKKSKDVSRLKKIGKVVYFNTFKYNLLFLNCDKIISSHAEPFVYQPFGKNNYCMRDLFKFKFIFLQHGIIKDDLSPWINRFSRNFSIFVTSAKKEYDSIVNNPKYGYIDCVKLTGLPRYDYLEKQSKNNKSILIAPTWRTSLAMPLRNKGEIEYNPAFKESEFFKFYDKLLTDKDILTLLKKKKYKIRFCLHYRLKSQIKDFKQSNYVELIINPNYQEEFLNNDLLVTDYSSIFFDFAYLDKPIVYNHFDKEDFFKGQIYNEGYFDYEKDAFGEVVYDYDSLKSRIINMIDNGCKNSKHYIDRKNNFFKYTDKNNCQRVYEEILKLDEK